MKIEHTAFNVEEPVATAEWYTQNLGLQIVRHTAQPPFAHFLADDSGTVMVEIYGNNDAPRIDFRALNPAEWHLAFVSEDVTADFDRLVAAGATVEAEVHRLGEDTFAMLRDPWGVPIQLVRRGQPMLRNM